MSTLEERLADRVNTRRYRQRRAGLLPPLPSCPSCGRASTRGAHAPLCRACWLGTPEGLEWNRERNRRQYRRRVSTPEGLEWNRERNRRQNKRRISTPEGLERERERSRQRYRLQQLQQLQQLIARRQEASHG